MKEYIVKEFLESKYFISGKYLKLYLSIINKALNENRIKSNIIYYENHHILPKCHYLTFKNDINNLVLLTAKEHYICHHLLTKCTKSNLYYKMHRAFSMFLSKSTNQQRIITAKQFEVLLKSKQISSANHRHTIDTKKRIQKSVLKYWTEDKKQEHSIRIKDIYNTDDSIKEKISIQSKHYWNSLSRNEYNIICDSRKGKNNGMYNKQHSESTKNLIVKNRDYVKNINFRGYFYTPWGKFKSANEAAKHSKIKISTNIINRYCITKNNIPISRYSIARNLLLSIDDLGKTPNILGYSFIPTTP